ncbi:MAG TPA: guanylate kinase [Bacteroidetes bacterium]|nr:guanylate kinase [Bacteroidota bacterium]
MDQKVIIVTAPSGAGKTTIVKHLLSRFPQLAFSVSATTRPPRIGEVNGEDYYFLSMEEFKNRVEAKEFVEFEEVYHHTFYGTLLIEVKRLWQLGKTIVFDVDVKGAITLKKAFNENALSLFIKPPSTEILDQRLRNRATDSLEKIQERISKAHLELEFEEYFDKTIVNDNLHDALEEAVNAVNDFINKPAK